MARNSIQIASNIPTAPTAPTAPKAPRAPKAPSAFSDITRVTLKVHHTVSTSAFTPEAVERALREQLPAGLAYRFVSRSKSATSHNGPRSLAVYVAPAGFAFPTARKASGARLDAETAEAFRALAAAAGLDPNDPASILTVARTLASRALGR